MATTLPAGITKTSTGFRAWIRLYPGKGGLRSKRYPPTATITAMKEWRADTRSDYRKDHPTAPPVDKATLAADVIAYLKLVPTMPTIVDRTRDLKAWVKVLGMRTRLELTTNDYRVVLQEWRLTGKRGGTPLSASSCNHRRTALLHLYHLLDGEEAPCPLRAIEPFAEPAVESRDAGLATVLAIIAAMRPSKTRARVKVLAWTGIRGNCEIGKMQREHVDLDARQCWVPTGKKGKPRVLTLNAHGVDAWQEFVLYQAWGKYSASSLRRSFMRGLAAVNETRERDGLAPFPHIRPYDMRHTIATALRRAGADLADIQAHLGHSSPEMSQRYAPYESTKLRAALEQVG